MATKQQIWIYHIQIFSNCFVIVFLDYNTQKFVEFAVNRYHNNFKELLDFLLAAKSNKDLFTGFNNLALHSQIIEDILKNKDTLLTLSSSELCTILLSYYAKTVELINNNKFSRYAEWNLSIQNIDVKKLNHLDKKKKPISLDWVRYMLDDDDISILDIYDVK